MVTYIYELARSRDDVKYKLYSKSNKFIEHLFKVYFMPNNDSFDKWCKEISNYYKQIDRFKGHKKFPKSNFIYNNIFGNSEDVFDNIFIVNQEYLKDEYNVTISDNTIDDIYTFIKEYTKWLSEKLSKDGVALKDDCKEKILELL